MIYFDATSAQDLADTTAAEIQQDLSEHPLVSLRQSAAWHIRKYADGWRMVMSVVGQRGATALLGAALRRRGVL